MKKFSYNRLIVFTRYPRPGLSKTRLIPALGPEGAARIQKALTGLTLKTILPLVESGVIQARVSFDGCSEEEMRQWLGSGFTYEQQAEGNLGYKMRMAFQRAFANEGVSRVVIVGTDIHDLTADIISVAFEALGYNDLVIGPAVDGGYYLIGMNSNHPQLFTDVDWGTNRVFEQTMFKASVEKLTTHVLQKLNDIDRPEDLIFLKKEILNSSLDV